MATHQDEETRGARLTLLTGLLVAGGAAAAAFGRVYEGKSVATRLVLLCAASFAIAAILERRHVLIATVASAAGMLIAIGWLIFPDTLRWGLPTLATLRMMSSALGSVGREAQVTLAPAPALPALVLAGVTAVWTAAFASHSLAVRARSPFLALAPQAALLAFAGIVVEDGARPGYVLMFLLGCFAVLFADALRRVGQWGSVSVWHGKRLAGLASRTTTRGAWRVAVGCLGVALFVPWLLPGFGGTSVLRLQGNASHNISLNPLVDIRPKLIQNPAVTLFTVASTAPTYWQILTLDTFDAQKQQWSPSDPEATHGVQVRQEVILPSAAPQYALVEGDAIELHERFVLAELAQPWLPVAADAETIQMEGSARYDPISGAVVLPGLTSQGLTYDVTSRVVIPTPTELDRVTAMGAANAYTQLPDNLPPAIAQLAHQWSAGGATPYRKILAIQDVLRGWTYDLRVAAPRNADDLVYFLTKGHRGYCQQFAGSMAVLLRALGYQTRVAVGFLPGSYNPRTQRWEVSTDDFHAWVQVLFPGYGWLSFDPTPTRFESNPTIASYDNPSTAPVGSACRGNQCFNEASGSTVNVVPPPNGRHDAPVPGTFNRGQFPNLFVRTPPERTAPDLRRIGMEALGVALLLLVVGTPIGRTVRRRFRLRRASAPATRVLAAYGVLLEVAADVGQGRRPAETIREYRRRIGRTVRFTGDGLDVLSSLADRAAYAHDGLSPADGQRAADLSRIAAKDLRRDAPWWRNVLGHYPIRFGREPSTVS